MRFREDNPAERARARAAVADWREQNPAGNAEELIAAIGHQFHRDYGVVLRAMLFAVDRHRARQVTGITFPGAGAMSAFRARLTGRVLGIAPDEPDQVLRLGRFREEHPDVIIGDGGFGTWQARIPEPNGVRMPSCRPCPPVIKRL